MKRYALFLLLLLFFLAPHKAAAQTTQEKCSQGSCYGFGTPSGSCVGAFIYSDISQTPVQAYSCKANAWVAQGSGASVPSGATADYKFLDGSGTTLSDSSGNGNNGTLGTSTAAPTWVPQGLHFDAGQNVLLPSSLNTTQTFVVAVNIVPISGPNLPANANFPALITSSGGNTSGLNWLLLATTPSRASKTCTLAFIFSGARHEAKVSGSRNAWYVILRGAWMILETLVLARMAVGSVMVIGSSS